MVYNIASPYSSITWVTFICTGSIGGILAFVAATSSKLSKMLSLPSYHSTVNVKLLTTSSVILSAGITTPRTDVVADGRTFSTPFKEYDVILKSANLSVVLSKFFPFKVTLLTFIFTAFGNANVIESVFVSPFEKASVDVNLTALSLISKVGISVNIQLSATKVSGVTNSNVHDVKSSVVFVISKSISYKYGVDSVPAVSVFKVKV